MSLVRILAAAALFLSASFPMHALAEEGEGEPKVRARLVADVTTAAPGDSLWLGVHFAIEDGWHIYWRYPGDAGLATDIQWRLPDGWTAGPLQWPTPIRFVQSGDLAGYGYEDEVMLASEVEVESGALAAVVGAEVSWLACKDVCVVGSTELEAAFEKLPGDSDLGAWRAALPRPLPDTLPPFEWRTTGGFGDGRLSLWLQWPDSAPEVEWYPDPPEAIEMTDVRVSSRASLTRIDAAVRRRAGARETDTLSSLVVVTDTDGVRRGWELELTIDD